MADLPVIRISDLRRYLDRFPDHAVVVRQTDDAQVEGAYLDLDVAMNHLEDEQRRNWAAGVSGAHRDGLEDDPEDGGDGSEDEYPEEERDDDAELADMRAVRDQQERNIKSWENDQR